MSPEKHMISLTLHHLGETHRVQTNRGEYHSLMTLISENLAIPGFGLCNGMGSCGTCRVEMCTPNLLTLSNMLSCDEEVNDGLANTDIIIPDKIY